MSHSFDQDTYFFKVLPIDITNFTSFRIRINAEETGLFSFLCIRPQIKPPRMANCDKFPNIRGEDCDPLRVIRGKNFSFNEYSFIY